MSGSKIKKLPLWRSNYNIQWPVSGITCMLFNGNVPKMCVPYYVYCSKVVNCYKIYHPLFTLLLDKKVDKKCNRRLIIKCNDYKFPAFPRKGCYEKGNVVKKNQKNSRIFILLFKCFPLALTLCCSAVHFI